LSVKFNSSEVGMEPIDLSPMPRITLVESTGVIIPPPWFLPIICCYSKHI
jgi:hypothetical protein